MPVSLVSTIREACNSASASCRTAIGFASSPTERLFANGKVMSSQFMFGDALQAERDLGLNYWEKECPNTDGLGVTIAGPDGGKAVS